MANQVLYGFHSLKDVFARRVVEAGVDVVSRAIDQSVAEHNRQIAAIFSLFVRPTTEYSMRYKTPTSARLQPMDENGRARPIKLAGYYDVAFPLQEGGAAWGANYRSRAKMTVQEANEATLTMLSADARWIRDHVLASLFTNASWSWTDPAHGALTIKGLANADTDLYLVMTGADAGATDTHYLAQAGAIADATNPFATMHDELTEHPENAGQVVVFVPTSNKAAVESLSNFTPLPDMNVRLGANQSELIGNLGTPIPGKLFGYVDECWVAEWPVLPANYLIGVTTDGEKPLGMREEPEAELQGFKRVADREDHPWYESQWLRIAGFGAWSRVGAVVQRVGNGAYAIPTNYEVPMP